MKWMSFVFLLVLAVAFSCNKTDEQPSPNVPHILSFSPDTAVGGAEVQIYGSGFSALVPEDVVSFNGKTALVTAATPTRLTVKVPMTAGTGVITVQISSATVSSAPVSSYTDFTYIYTVSTLAGGDEAAFADGKGADARFSNPMGLAADAAGNVYVADEGNYRVRKITPDGTVSTLAGDGTINVFNGPNSVALDGKGIVYVSDIGHGRIAKIAPDGTVSTLAGANGGYVNDRGLLARFSNPLGIAVDKFSNVYVADNGNDVIRKIDPVGVVTTYAGDHNMRGFLDGYSSDAEFSGPIGIATDAGGNCYVVEINDKRIRKIDAGGVVSTLAGTGRFGINDGVGVEAGFDFVPALATDGKGNVYAADRFNCNIRMITPAGVTSTIAGGKSRARAFVDGPGPDAKFNNPAGIAVDARGVIYVADVGNNRIRKLQ